jgi:signal transduction histidine kinase
MREAPAQPGARSWAWVGRVPAWVWDVLPTVPLLLLNGVTAVAAIKNPYHNLEAAALLGLTAAVSLIARRRAPMSVLAIAGLAAFGAISISSRFYAPASLTVLMALYSVDTRCSRRWSLAASGVTLGGAVLAEGVVLGTSPHMLATVSIAPAALVAAFWVFGDNVRVRRAYVAGLEERAAWVDAQRAADARRAADDERARIARELHDVVAHHVAVVAVQAGAARMLSATVDQQSRELLVSIENSAHQAMSELRRLLGVLRRDGGSRPVPAPAPGLDQLTQLIDQVRQAGLPVELTVVGEVNGLPDWVELSAYRIVQEALTNVLKHAGPAATSVCLRRGRREVTLAVTNKAPLMMAAATPQDRTGHGLIGMRERVAMAGGELRAGPTADGGFEVFARLPAEPRRASPRSLAAT